MKVQTMTAKQAEEAWANKGINVFDLTHIWPHKDYPLREIGKVTLNKNAKVSASLRFSSPTGTAGGTAPSVDSH